MLAMVIELAINVTVSELVVTRKFGCTVIGLFCVVLAIATELDIIVFFSPVSVVYYIVSPMYTRPKLNASKSGKPKNATS